MGESVVGKDYMAILFTAFEKVHTMAVEKPRLRSQMIRSDLYQQSKQRTGQE